ncbi:hypothetical protein MKZ38_000769 [Zalerion maritima]|uniref:Uncharacterized protein n=1 Tax=Zalerion maritima TaxID=339359 RepID=A0AAD5RG29_9PEZI|nr:hypothetical protein MKZ38_000769 [Zalerion maritima]
MATLLDLTPTLPALNKALEVQSFQKSREQSMCELILDEGTVMLQADVIKNCKPSRVTGWKFQAGPGGPRFFNAGKPHPKLENVDDLKEALVNAGVL